MTQTEIIKKIAGIICLHEFLDIENTLQLAEQLREIADTCENMYNFAHPEKSVTDEG